MNIGLRKKLNPIIITASVLSSTLAFSDVIENGEISSNCHHKGIKIINNTCKGIRLSSTAARTNLITLQNKATKGQSIIFRNLPPVASGDYTNGGQLTVKIIDEKNDGFHTAQFNYQWQERNGFCETSEVTWSITPESHPYRISSTIRQGNYIYTIIKRPCKRQAS